MLPLYSFLSRFFRSPFIVLLLFLLTLFSIFSAITPSASPQVIIVVGSSDGHIASSGAFYPYEINYSCRFNDDDSAYLSRTPAGAGNRKTWTFSTWVKRANLVDSSYLISAVNGSAWCGIWFANHNLYLYDYNGTSYTIQVNTTDVLRDPSSWYHIVVSINTVLASVAAGGVRVWLNGTELILTATTYVQNTDTTINAACLHRIGVNQSGTLYFGEYLLAETIFIGGSQLTSASFGELKGGVWVPAEYTGSYTGTNGFRLDFANSADLGNDVSGNGNDWTSTNLTATDQLTDTPTNNFCTINLIDTGTSTLTEGNLQATGPDATVRTRECTFGISAGKWYWEGRITDVTKTGVGFGLMPAGFSRSAVPGNTADSLSFYVAGGPLGKAQKNNIATTLFDPVANGDWIMFALDMDAGKVWIGRNGTWYNSGDPAAGTGETYSGLSGILFPSITVASTTLQLNFGQDSANVASGNADGNGHGSFEHSPPTGFLALCTTNLTAQSSFSAYSDCATEDETGTVTYTGNGSSEGPFVFTNGHPADICIDGTHYDVTSADFDFLSNGIKVRSAVTKNTAATSYTLEYWLEDDIKYANAELN